MNGGSGGGGGKGGGHGREISDPLCRVQQKMHTHTHTYIHIMYEVQLDKSMLESDFRCAERERGRDKIKKQSCLSPPSPRAQVSAALRSSP